jgi:putative oxidoreductase
MWTLTFFTKFAGLPPLILRGVLGYSFFAVHGLQKLNPKRDWNSLDAWDWGSAFVEKAGHAAALSYIAAWTEFLAGFALILGLLTRWASLGLLGIMLFAVLVHHADDPYLKKELGIAYAGACLTLACVGPGSFSLDRLFFGRSALED